MTNTALKYRLGTITFFALILVTAHLKAQPGLTSRGWPKSYSSFGPLTIEDNSFLLEEAFNQDAGVIQNVFNVRLPQMNSHEAGFGFTQEIPLAGENHQLSYSINYSLGNTGGNDGMNDLAVSYRPLLTGRNAFAMIIPRFTLILPTGRAQSGLGYGTIGTQFNLAVTKRFTRELTSHYNAGFTYFRNARIYSTGELERKTLFSKSIGASIIWSVRSKFNMMVEYTTNINDVSEVIRLEQCVNPAMRFSISINKMQMVPGLGLPVQFSDGSFQGMGMFVYLSFEPDYRNE